MKSKIKKNQGITMISLVVTMIVLLVLAGVTMSMTFSRKGIYNRAKQTAEKYDEAKAYEILELTLGEAQMKKYTEGLTDEELSTMINEIGSEMERNPDSDYHNVIVGGYIFEIDRSVPEIVKEVGPADGIVITAKVSGDGGWTNGTNVNITVTGTITTYGAGKITSSSATNNGVPIADFPTKGGDYTISGIASDTTIVITAENSKGREERKEIPIKIRIDKTAPSLSGVSVTAEDGKKIRITANAQDTESGVKQINYNVYPTSVNSPSGSFMPGDEVVLTAENVGEYTITFTAEDNVGNKSADQVETVTTKADSTPPTFRNVRVVANGMIIRASVVAEDLSGIKQLSYTVSPSTTTPSTGILNSGEELKLTATEAREYTITFTATDNAGNVATTTATAETKNKITVAEAKSKINSSNIQDYLGIEVEYNSPKGGKWQVFYFDDTDGYFGEVNTVYLKRAYVSNDSRSLEDYVNHTPTDNGEMMKRMNPQWRDSTNSNSIDLKSEHCVSWLCDTTVWADYRNPSYSSFAIGSPSVEMYMKAFNIYKTGNKNANSLVCEVDTSYGYAVGANGKYLSSRSTTDLNSIEAGPDDLFIPDNGGDMWLSSPSRSSNQQLYIVYGGNCNLKAMAFGYDAYVCPIVPLDIGS